MNIIKRNNNGNIVNDSEGRLKIIKFSNNFYMASSFTKSIDK